MRGFIERLPLYIGGLMGPFGTIVIIPMFPELRDEFGATSGQVSLAFSLYLIPFALLLLVSGTLGERWGRRRTVRTTYIVYALASVMAALAPNLAVFVVARALQGVANAFITPLLIAGLAETVPPERLGREVGIYSSFQALGGGLGPVLGGVAADTWWPLAFVGTAVMAAGLALVPPPGEARTDQAAAPSLRPLFTRRLVLLGLAFFFAAVGPLGVSVLVGVAARDVHGFSGTTTGLVLFAGSMSALALGPPWGRVLDSIGSRRAGLGGIAALIVMAAVVVVGTTPLLLGALWVIASAFIALVTVVFQSLGASVMPDNRGGALSFILSFRFVGHAVGPLIFVPFVEGATTSTFVVAASLGLVTLALVSAALPAST